MVIAISIISPFLYAMIGAVFFAYVSACHSKDDGYNKVEYYWDEPYPWLAGIFWPIVAVWMLIIWMPRGIAKLTFDALISHFRAKEVRIKQEERKRVEVSKAIKDAEQEVEHILTEEYVPHGRRGYHNGAD